MKRKITRDKPKDLPAPVKDRAPTKAGKRVLNMAPHDPKEVIEVGAAESPFLTGTGAKTQDLAQIIPVRKLKTKLKPRAPKRKRTVVPVVKQRFHVERTPEDQEAMDSVEEAHQAAAANVGGRPSKYQPIFNNIVKVMSQGGATDKEMADALGITTDTFYRWQHVHPGFSESIRTGKGRPDDRVERSLFLRAVGYSYESEKIGFHLGTVVRAKTIEHVPPDPKAITLWLTNRRGKKWRVRQELTGADGKSLIPKGKHEMTRAELLAIAAEARKAK